MITVKADNIDEYIAAFPKETQQVLRQIRTTIRRAAPGAEETISYAIPCFNLEGHYLIYFAGYKKHVSVYPAPRGDKAFKEELAQYKGGKGTVQFPLDKPIPYDLITRMVKFKIKQRQEEKSKQVKKKKPS
jgi:uncharacterized protein YdhG (YjbR/CyaY superfamily)